MKGQFSAKFRRFGRSGDGAAIIEFALVFPLMLLFTFGIMEVSLYMASLVTLEGGLKEASRYGMITSQTPGAVDLSKVPVPFKKDPSDLRMATIGLILNRHTLDLINLDKADVKTETFTNFMLTKDGEPYSDKNGNGQWDPGEPWQDIACPIGNGIWDGPKSTGSTVGAAGAIVVYTINYSWQVMTPMVGQFLGKPDPNNAGRYIIPMSATIVVKNEPALSGSTFAC
ncbi:TadE/TadG family type IV pilus assembly protein [Dongia sedimenti]|uniref:Pilus assembly protein n=1 Tax=Dongia sedimenti TaxID=3064282 RepID=A0ABU0YQ99_9PROT|nr:pilus assembly protein [Rhodospirillaceae bacterium R-7]